VTPQPEINRTFVCPKCGNVGAHVLAIAGGTLCCCAECRHLWIDAQTLPAPESPFRRRATDGQKEGKTEGKD